MDPLFDLNIGYGRLLLRRIFAALYSDRALDMEALTADWAEIAPLRRIYDSDETIAESENLVRAVKGLIEDGGGVTVSDSAASMGDALAETAKLSRLDSLKFADDIADYHLNKVELLRTPIRSDEHQLVGENASWLEILTYAKRIAATNVPVTITGETGTGKEVIARYIHRYSRRSSSELMAVNCGAIPDSLVESELFGYQGGAFTGAERSGKQGRLEAASGGTVLLDDIDGLSARAQTALLRFIETGELQKLGSVKSGRANVRIICTSNKDLAKLKLNGDFRPDLYYRINIFRIHILPLRERRDDIPLFARHFLREIASETSPSAHFTISEAAVKKLENFDWPGNLREMQGALWRAAMVCRDGHIRDGDISFDEDESGFNSLNRKSVAVSADVKAAVEKADIQPSERAGLVKFLSEFRGKEFSNRHFAEYFRVSSQTARNRLKSLEKAGLIIRTGQLKGSKYIFKEDSERK